VFETNNYNCSATSSAVSVIVNPTPPATISYTSNDLCQTGSVTLTANSGGGYTYQWLKGTMMISGATNQAYTTTQRGSYRVVVMNPEGCSKTSMAVKVVKTCKEISEAGAIADASLTVYPNPSDGLFVINLSLDDETLNDEADVQIFNVFGQMVYQSREPVSNGILLARIDLRNHLAGGNYFVRVVEDDKVFNTQIILQK
jgi:hypothetical protein